jgi:serine/threonine protein kinase
MMHLEQYDIAPLSALNSRSIKTRYSGSPITTNQNIPQDLLLNEGRRLFNGLHHAGVQHNDIRGKNILFNGSRLTLIDFSLSDTPWLSISDLIPDKSWGRFGPNNRLLALGTEDLH